MHDIMKKKNAPFHWETKRPSYLKILFSVKLHNYW